MEIEPWDESDTDWWVGLRRAWQPMMGEAQVRLVAAGKIVRFDHRAVAWRDGARVGFASLGRAPGNDDTMASVLVADDQRGSGVGSALFADLLGHTAGRKLMTFMPDGDDVSLSVAEHWGFEVVSHAVRSRLDLRSAPPGTPSLGERTVRVIDAASPVAEKAWLNPLVVESDTSPEAVELGWRSTVADFERMFPAIVWVVVEEAGVPLAAASASPQDAGSWLVVYTGVRAENRRQGLARLAKQCLHAEVAERGGVSLTTDNEVRNAGIRGLNADLGYERIGGEIRLERRGLSA